MLADKLDTVRNKKFSMKSRNTLIAYSFILPNFIGFFIFNFVPIVMSLVISLTDWDSFSAPTFIGLDNFVKMMNDDLFWHSLGNTFFYTVGVVPVTVAISLLLAILLNKKFKGVKFFRTAFFFPYDVTSLVAAAVVWNMLFHPTMGPINQFLSLFTDNLPGWTSSSDWSLISIMIVSVWRWMGYYMVLYLAGLQSSPAELYEAASIDGANNWSKFWNITVPSLAPTTFLVTTMLIINSFKVFDLVEVMTQGGPGRSSYVLVYQIYNEAFVNFDFGYASALAFVLFILVLVITVIQFKWNSSSVD